MNFDNAYAEFRTTCWTIVNSLGQGTPEEKRCCLDTLYRLYYSPVYAFLRRMGDSPDQAAEITQAFFTDVVLQRDLFEKAAEGRGKLRSLIRKSVKRFRIDLHRRAVARGSMRREPLDFEWLERSLVADGATPEQVFDRVFDAGHLDDVWRSTEQHFVGKGMEDHWRLYEAHRILPARSGGKSPGLHTLAKELGFCSEGAARSAVQVVVKHTRLLYAMRAGEA